MGISYGKTIVSVLCILFLNNCYSNTGFSPEYRERFILMVSDLEAYQVTIHLDRGPIQVPLDTPFEIHVPQIKECRSFCLGMPVSGPRFENRNIIVITHKGKEVKKMSLSQLRKLPLDTMGNRVIRMR